MKDLNIEDIKRHLNSLSDEDRQHFLGELRELVSDVRKITSDYKNELKSLVEKSANI